MALAELARGRLRVKHAALVEALTGQFTEHHAFVARMLLDQIDTLGEQIQRLTAKIEQTIAAIPAAMPPAGGPGGGPGRPVHDAIGPVRSVPAAVDPQTGEVLAAALPVVDRLDEVAGIGRHAAQVLIAELGLDMDQFPTPGHLVSWARLAPRTIQSGARHRSGATGKGNPYPKAARGEAATAAAKTDTFLGERYRRLVRRIGKGKALVAVARSILVIVWHLLADPTARFHDLGADYHASRIDRDRKPATWCTSSRRSATRSPSSPPPDPQHPADPALTNYRPGSAATRLAGVIFRSGWGRRFDSGGPASELRDEVNKPACVNASGRHRSWSASSRHPRRGMPASRSTPFAFRSGESQEATIMHWFRTASCARRLDTLSPGSARRRAASAVGTGHR